MIPTRVTVRSPDPELPPFEVDAWVPFEGSPLAVTRVCIWESHNDGWKEAAATRWIITHVPTGYNLGHREWTTKLKAFEALEACDPRFPAWAFATRDPDSAATKACKAK